MRPCCLSRVKHGRAVGTGSGTWLSNGRRRRAVARSARRAAAALRPQVEHPAGWRRRIPRPAGRWRHPAAAAPPRSGKRRTTPPATGPASTPSSERSWAGSAGQEARGRPGGNAAPCACRGASALSLGELLGGAGTCRSCSDQTWSHSVSWRAVCIPDELPESGLATIGCGHSYMVRMLGCKSV